MTGVQSGGSLPTGGPDDIAFDAGRGSALINNGGDNVTVYDPTNDAFIQATFNGDALDDPTTGSGGYSGFSASATRNGAGEDFGNDTDGLSRQRTGDGADTVTPDTPTPAKDNVCYADGTRLLTPTGEKAVEALGVGDLVMTLDHGAQPVVWTHVKRWRGEEIARARNLAPVRIAAGALGEGVPRRDLRVSQQHGILVRGAIAARMFGAAEVLIPAKALLGLPTVTRELPKAGVGYHHIMLARHEVLRGRGRSARKPFPWPTADSVDPGGGAGRAARCARPGTGGAEPGCRSPRRPDLGAHSAHDAPRPAVGGASRQA